jgi:hypothetical protein
MAVATRYIEIPIPEGVELTQEQRELLEASLRAAVPLHCDNGRHHEVLRRQLEAEGWCVKATVAWCAEARRGRDLERGFGQTRDEAFEELCSLIALDQAGEGPS